MGNDELIKHMKDNGYLKTEAIAGAFRAIDRIDFTKSNNPLEVYGDYPLHIGAGQTISQPSTVAFMLELLDAKPGNKILDVGSGSGWTTALLVHLVGPSGKVFGVEKILELFKFGKENLAKYNFKNASITLAGSELGLVHEAPFDRILVSAAANSLPQSLVDQLALNGRLVIPIRSSILLVTKDKEGKTKTEAFYGFSFVPLV